MPQVGMFPEDEPKEPGALTTSPGTLTSRGSAASMFPESEPDRLTDGLSRAPSIGADAAARAFKLQIKTGLPVDVIRRNLDEVERQAAATDFDPIEFRKRAPKLAGWIESDPNHGALAHDDLVPLTGLESVFNFGANAAGALAGGFFEHANMGAYGVAEAAGDLFSIPELTAWGKKKGAEAKAIGQQFRGTQAGVGRTGRAVLGGFESVGAAAPVLVASVITKNPTLALGLIGVQSAGPAYSEARAEGAGVGTSLLYAGIEGAVEVATEKLPIEGLVGDLAAGSGLLKTIGRQLLTEIPGEQVATALQDLNAWALLHPDKPFADYLEARPGAFWDTFVSTVVATGVQTGATRALDRAVAGDRGKQFTQDLGEATKATKLAGRSPEKLEELIATMAEDSPTKTVLLPVENVTEFYQQQGLDPAEAARELTGDPNAYAEALQTGADLAVPVARYATRIAATDAGAYFADVVRLAPGEMNAQERAAFLEAARTIEPATESATEEGPAPGADVTARITNALTAAGVKPAIADRYARLYGAVFSHGLVARAGLDARTVFERYGLRFERTTLQEAGLEETLAKVAEGRVPPAGSAESGVSRGTSGSTAAPAAGEAGAGTGAPAGAMAGLEDVEGLADVLAGLGAATLTEAPEGSTGVNASGESAASAEALSRGAGMASRGEQFVVYDRAGNERPLVGPDAVDYTARPGETYGVRTPTGFRLLEDRGGKVPAEVSSPRGAQTGARPGDAGGQRGRPDADRRPEGASDGGDTQRRRLPTSIELAERDGDKPFEPATAEEDAARFTPEHVRELERVAEELEQFGFQPRTWHWLGAASRKVGNAAGGGAIVTAGAAGSPVLDDILELSPLSKGAGGKGAAKQVRGTREQIAKLLRAALESRRIKSNLVEGAMRVAERRAADDYRDISRPTLPPSWGEEVSREFTDELSTLVDQQIEELGLDEQALEGEGDPTFDPTEFEQRDKRTSDLLDTGEEQPRLPGAEDVRDQDIATPTFEAPFALTSPTAKPERGKRAAPGPSPAYLEALEKSRVASQAFSNAQRQFRAGEITDAQFLEARTANEAAQAEFDQAFAAEEELASRRGRATLFQLERGHVGTPAFRAWFKDSKVVDENGDPLVVHHGTGNRAGILERGFSHDFTDRGNDQFGSGFYFTNRPVTAKGYTTRRIDPDTKKIGGETDPGVLDVFLSIQKPIIVDASKPSRDTFPPLTRAQVKRLIASAPDINDFESGPLSNWGDVSFEGKTAVLNKAIDAYVGGDGMALANDFYPQQAETFLRAYSKLTGYDGVITEFESGERHYVAWFPEQIKSATDNVGTFDPGDANILRQEKKPGLEAQGVIQFGADRKFTIKLFEKANLSTVLHESAHFYLELLADIVTTLEQLPAEQRTAEQNGVLADFGALSTWLGEDAGGERVAGSRFTRGQHEKFARGFEAYLLEGRPPSEELRPSFEKFRQWLGEIYRNLLGLERAAGERLELTPEVRGVFDRMLASDAQIERVRREQVPIFLTAADAGMTEAEFALYRGQIEKANLATQAEIDRRLMADIQRQRTAAYKAQREAVESAVVEELNAAPVYRALAAMRYGTNPDGSSIVEGEPAVPMKLSKKMLVEQVGAARLKTLPRPYIYSAEGGIDPKLAAEMFGFDSVDRMLNEFEAALPYPQVVQGETDRRMVAQYGDLLLDGGLADARKAATANDDRELVIRAELRALEALRRQTGPFVRQARAEATATATAERDYERRWFEAEAKLRIAIAEGYKQAEIERLRKQVASSRRRVLGAAPAIRRGIPSAGLLRDAARVRLGATTVENIRPTVWFESAKRNGLKAQEAAARQDIEAAIDFKTQELFSLALYREAVKQVEILERRVGKARDLAKPAARARLGLAGDSYLDQIDGILDRLEFAKVSAKALARRASIAKFVAALEGQGLPVELPAEVLDDARRTNYRKLTVDELTGVLDGIDQILHLARLKNRLLKRQEKRNLDELAGDLAANIRAKFTRTKRAVSRDRRPSDERMRTIDGYFASQTKLSTIIADLDGFEEGGPMWDAVLRLVNEAGDAEALENEKATKALHALVEAAFPGLEKARLYERLDVPAVGRSMSRMERIMVALNYGNDGNKERILEGEGWTEAQAQAVIDSLEKSDLEFVQGVFDFFESYRPAIGEKQKRITGLEPTWVEATPIRTRHGDYRGGYFPIKADDRLSASAAAKLELDAANLAKLAAFTRPTTKRGHLEERKGGTDPVVLSFSTIFEHTSQVIHDLTHHEMLIDVGRILGHRDVQTAIYETHGDQVYKDIKAHLRDIALGDIPAQDGFERALQHARTGATVVGLGWSLTTPLYQPLGLTVSWRQVGGKWVAKGISRWIRDAASLNSTVAWVHERSVFMRLRHKTQQREINEIRNAVGVETGRFSAAVDAAFQWGTFGRVDRQAIADSYFFLIGRAQMIADVPTWIGAYEKALAGGKDDATAVALADQAVLDTQGGGQIKDLAPVQKGSASKKLWTNFYSAFNVFYNQAVRAQRAKNLRNPIEVGRLAADYFLIYIAPATLTFALPELVKYATGDEGEEDSEGFWAGLVRSNLSYVMGSMIGFRELSGVVQGYAGYEGPAGARGFSAAARFAKQADQWISSGFDPDKLDAAFWRNLADTAGVWLHFPIGQTRRTLEGLASIIEGKSHDPTDIVTGPPR